MPLIFLLFLPFLVIGWMIRYFLHLQDQQTRERMQEELARAEVQAMVARPLKDYVANLQPKSVSKVPFHIPFVDHSPPTLGNIGRFAALSIRSHSDEYFVRDGQGVLYGPADETILHQWIRENRITMDTLVSIHREGPWLPARKVRALQEVFDEVAQPLVSQGRFDNIQIG